MVIMDLAYLGMVLVVILVSMTLHEAMHAFMGYFLGDDTAKAEGRLTLNPLKHIDPFMTLLLPLLLAMLGLVLDRCHLILNACDTVNGVQRS